MKMFINGQRKDASDRKTIDVVNSATLEVIDTVPAATETDVYEAIEAAKEGSRFWKNTPVHERTRILCRAADMIDERREELARSLSTEMGKIISEARPEVRAAAQIIRGYAEKANHLYGETMTDYQVGTENDIVFTRREPLGVAACITPFNYPVELSSHKYASALAAGNAVIVKPATDNPLTVMKVTEILWEAGVPGNVLQLVTGSGSVIGDILTESPDIQAVTFTGSTEVGLHIAEKAAKTLKRVMLELGGNDPYIVFEDADFELAVTGAVRGRVQNAGQTCCSPKRFLVQNSIKEKFIERAVKQINALKHGSPLDDDTELGSLISAKAAKKVDEQVKMTIAQGGRLICGGKPISETYYEPTIIEVSPDTDIARDMECFGPVIPIIGFDTEEEAIAISNQSMYGLQAGVITRDMNKALRVASRLECGGVVINQSGNYRHMDQPFGGWKMSGTGREGISVTLEELTQLKSYVLRNILV